MTPNVKPFVAGNWKMNGTSAVLGEAQAVAAQVKPGVDMALCVPATLIHRAAQAVDATALMIGGQDVHAAANGAHTGDTAADMLVDAGAKLVIVGHSERRADHGENSETVAAKAQAAIDAGLIAVICVGETQTEREAGKAAEIVLSQLTDSVPDAANAQNTVVAYEPVWAIGTGLTASTGDIEEIHTVIRDALCARFKDGAMMRILYGGSVKPSNAGEIFAVANVDGGLIGGASLKSADFLAICEAANGI
ncbi:MAG: triose-phosphate isomerase [Ahrensia sp.]